VKIENPYPVLPEKIFLNPKGIGPNHFGQWLKYHFAISLPIPKKRGKEKKDPDSFPSCLNPKTNFPFSTGKL
jgi:hypothetical protein